MSVRRTVAASALGLSMVLGPTAVAWAGNYPPTTPPGTPTPSVTPSVVPTATETTDTQVVGVRLPRTGGEMAIAGVAGAALVGGGAVLVGAARRRAGKH